VFLIGSIFELLCKLFAMFYLTENRNGHGNQADTGSTVTITPIQLTMSHVPRKKGGGSAKVCNERMRKALQRVQV